MAIRSLTLPLLLLIATTSFAQIVPPSGLAGGRAVGSSMTTHPQPTELAVAASNGSGFLAAWRDTPGGKGVVAARFDDTGMPLEPTAVPLYPSRHSDRPSVVLSDGRGYAVFGSVFTGTLPTRIEADGAVLHGAMLPGLFAFGGAWNGSRFAVAFFRDRAPMQLRFFDRELNPVDTVDLGPEFSSVRSTAVAAGDGRFLIVWEDFADTFQGRVTRLRSQILDDRGKALTEPHEIASVAAERYAASFQPAVSWNGSRFVVVWSHAGFIRTVAISPEGQVGGSFQFVADPGGMSIAWDGHTHLLVWRETSRETWTNSYEAATLSSDAQVTARFTVPVNTAIPTAPAVASNGAMFFVVAGERRLAVTPSSSQRVRDLGTVAPGYVQQTSPVITAGANRLLVAWNEGGKLWAGDVLKNGAPGADGVLDAPLGEASSGKIFAASAAHDLHLVAWQEGARNRTRATLVATNRLANVEIPSTATYPVGLASDGSAFAIVWTEWPSGQPSQLADLVIGIVDQSGSVAARRLATSPAGHRVFAFGWTGSEYALVWRKFVLPECQSITCRNEYEDRITLLDASGNVKSEAVISLPPPDARVTAVVSSDGVMVASIDPLPPIVRTQKFAFDGSAAAPRPAYDPNRLQPLYPIRLVRTTAGYTLFAQYPTEWTIPMAEPRSATFAILLDSEGTVRNELSMGDMIVNDAIHAFGTTWITYTAPWYPLPHAHDGRIMRAFYKALPERTRAVRR